MDPFLARLFAMQTDPGGGGGDAGGGAPAAVADPAVPADPAAPVGDPAAPAEPAAPAALSYDDDPAFLAAVDQRAAAMVEQRLQSFQPPAPAQQQQGQPVDLNELLNPLDENFGQNFAQFLADRDRYLLGQINEQMQPLVSREEQAQNEAEMAQMDAFVAKNWNEQSDGKLTPELAASIKIHAEAYFPEAKALYGETPTAATVAIQKAAQTVRALTAAARGAGAVSNADQLAAIANAAGEPGTGGGAIQLPPAAKSERDVLARYFGPNGGTPAA